ncbi:RHS repeat-associated core domain-containing protein, partial [Comamonas sp. MYb21]|uniref:RHS repeat-associated core domain-containing protein n=1 Tax=Comamonas sp. MYb21 TaxID=1848648 RepID=UPI00309F0F09
SGLYQPIRLPGQHADGDTGLYYNRYRYYEAGGGDYVNQDPIGLHGGVHTSGYVRSPLIKSDSLGLIEELAHIWNIGPLDAWNTRADNAEALKRSQEKFPNHELHNGTGDAFRHCYWSCVMSLRMGTEQAKKVGDTHEVYGTKKRKQPKKEEIMDYHNNSKGRECSAFSTNNNDCEMKCDEKLGSGELWFIDKATGLLDTTIKIP